MAEANMGAGRFHMLGLPLEILTMIIDEALIPLYGWTTLPIETCCGEGGSKSTARTLSQVCQLFKAIIRPMLYRSLSFKIPEINYNRRYNLTKEDARHCHILNVRFEDCPDLLERILAYKAPNIDFDFLHLWSMAKNKDKCNVECLRIHVPDINIPVFQQIHFRMLETMFENMPRLKHLTITG
ncbi:hypothetical protein BT63DRAFT_53413 [Microthyrium microscopicum]|uniref:Uncharacterized protein n=1 Tax=Microthyrium microscopicum TaxID=703497 RepID=A0A6A6U5K5_9PEZI|nr:hypothetical protein BT63DRAFT_53413 [Microthyrium microscopicum]